VLNTQQKLGNSLLKNLIGLRETKGEIRIEDVGAILQGMASSLQSGTEPDRFLRHEIERMAEYIISARNEVIAMLPDPEEGAPKNINAASQELSEVVKATEEATNTIMDAADKIQEAISSLNDPKVSQVIMDQTMKLYDACSFQDITGQRINKVLKTLEQVEERVVTLVALFGGKLPEGYEVPEHAVKHMRPDEHLLHGPQLGADMPSQEEIDKLFSSME
jgi:chemotaxis protein CheZ